MDFRFLFVRKLKSEVFNVFLILRESGLSYNVGNAIIVGDIVSLSEKSNDVFVDERGV